MRKLTALLLAMLLLVSLTACGDSDSSDIDSSSKPTSSAESDDPVSSDPASIPVSGTTTSKDDKSTTSRSRSQTTTSRGTTTTTSPSDFVSTVGEKPYTGNAAILYNKQTSKFDSQAESLRQSILNEKDTVKAKSGGTTYYISPKGDDNNPGTSKDKPWRTAQHLYNHLIFKAGDAVLFERGGVYRNVSFHLASGVSYGAYGNGAKPCLYGSKQNYADEKLWKKTTLANVWCIDIGKSTPDVGNLVFDHGKQVGLKVRKNSLTADYEFYHDANNGYVYLYLTAGNPGKVFSDIEICVRKTIMYTKANYKAENITIENLSLKYTGAHGIGIQAGSNMESKNITVRGCEIGWIGGSMLDKSVRYGNGIELNGGVDGALVEDNWVYQCYDAGYTNQGNDCYQKNITVQDNLLEYSPYNIEVWTEEEIGKGGMKNSTFKNNTLRFAGYGWGSLPTYRHGSNTSVVGNISFYTNVVPCENVVISGNIFDCSYRYVVCLSYPNDTQGRGPTVTGNTWNQKTFSNSDTNASVNVLMFSGKEILQCKTLDEMKANVAKVDKAPKAIDLEK